MQTWFPSFFGVDLHIYSTLHGQFSFGKSSGPTTKATGSEVLLQVVYYEFRSCYISQTNQAGCEKDDGTIHYIVYIAKSYGFDQVIFIVWITFFLFKKHFSFLKLVHYFLANFYFFIKWQAFRNYEKWFLFHLKSSFRS